MSAWRWVEYDPQTEDCERLVDADGNVILDLGNATQFYPSAGTVTDNERHRALIADAPALLDALLEARNEIVKLARGRDGADDDLLRLNRLDLLLRKHGRLP